MQHNIFPPGHGDSNTKLIPTLVQDLHGVGYVACGPSQTFAVARDGSSTWSFGGGANGLLGMWSSALEADWFSHGLISFHCRPWRYESAV